MIKIPMNTSSGCLLSHRFSVARRAFPAAAGAWKLGPWGNPNQLHLKEGIFYEILLLPVALSTRELWWQLELWFFPHDTERGGRGPGLVHPTAASRAPSPPQPEERAEKTWGEDKQQQDENTARKIQLRRYRKLSELQGHWRLGRQMGHWPRGFGEVILPQG